MSLLSKAPFRPIAGGFQSRLGPRLREVQDGGHGGHGGHDDFKQLKPSPCRGPKDMRRPLEEEESSCALAPTWLWLAFGCRLWRGPAASDSGWPWQAQPARREGKSVLA